MSNTRVKRYINEASLMDDLFFELFFKKDPKYIEEVIRQIFSYLKLSPVKIVSVSTQYNLITFGGRNPKLDLWAENEEGKLINIEVQRSVGPDLVKRARFYSSAMDTNCLEKGVDYQDLPESYVIFITSKDFRKKGKPIYVIERVFLDDGESFSDGSTILFVNGEYRGNDPIGRLMNDFNTLEPENMTNKVLKERMTELKVLKVGDRELTGLDADIYSGVFDEGQLSSIQFTIDSMVREGCSWDLIRKCVRVPENLLPEITKIFPDFAKIN